jgi:hypothetical protein
MDLVKYILGELAVIRGAPVAFLLSLLATSLLIFYLMTWGYGRENSYLRTQLDDYKEKLKGATPQEARDRIDQLEKLSNEVIGKRWQPLTPAQIDKLAEELKPFLNTVKVSIMYENSLGKSLAESVDIAFDKAGWTNRSLGTGSGLGPHLSVGVGSNNALKLKKAVEAATGYRIDASRPQEPEWSGLIYFAVGINVD